MVPDCKNCPALGSSLFRVLEPDQFERIQSSASVQTLERGDTLYVEGAPALAAYCVQEGALKLTRMGEKGERQIIRLLGPAAVFGLRPILADDIMSTTAQALSPATVCVFPRALILELLDESRTFARALARDLAEELRRSEDMIMALTQRPVKRRAADVLLLLHGHAIRGDRWKPFPPMDLKRREIAQMINTTPETLSRVLAEFAEMGLIRVNRRNIELLDLEALQTVASAKYGNLDNY